MLLCARQMQHLPNGGKLRRKVRADVCWAKLAMLSKKWSGFAELESRNCGKPLIVRSMMKSRRLSMFFAFSRVQRCLNGLAAGEYLEGHTSMIRRDPLGVVAVSHRGIIR